VGPDGATTAVPELRGLDHLCRLLERPGTPLAALDLATDGRPTVVQSDLGPLADRQALAAYHHRLQALDGLMSEAEGDLPLLDRLTREREALLAEVGAATGIRGRPRTCGSTQERARVAVTKAISTAIHRITEADATTGAHLSATIHTGTYCSYEPDPAEPITWVLRG
jgi:hypothetical protein